MKLKHWLVSCRSCRNYWIRWIKDQLCIIWEDISFCWESSSILKLVRLDCWPCRSIARPIKMMPMFRIRLLILGLWKWWNCWGKKQMSKLGNIYLLPCLPLLGDRIYRPNAYSLKLRDWNYWPGSMKMLHLDWLTKSMFYGEIYCFMMTIFTALTMICHTSATLPT